MVVVALVGLGAGLLAGLAAGWTALLPAYLALALAVVPLAVIDVEHHRLPDRLVAVALVGGAALLTVAAAATGHWAALARAGEAAALVLGLGTALTLVAPFGFGDTKLATVLAGYLGWFGWPAVLYGLAAGFVLAAVAVVPLVALRRATMKSPIPLGPALIAGALLGGRGPVIAATRRYRRAASGARLRDCGGAALADCGRIAWPGAGRHHRGAARRASR